jgi:hypothetical protein
MHLEVKKARISLQSPKTELRPQNMHVKKVLVGLKRKKQASNPRVLVDFKSKKQDCLQVFYCYFWCLLKF